MIEEYRFGLMTINGKNYHHDVQAKWTGEVSDWLREEPLIIDLKDVAEAIEQNPETLIIGTGELGLAQVTESAQEEIRSRGIELIIDRTEAAVKTFNIRKDDSLEEEGVQEKVIGLFYLT